MKAEGICAGAAGIGKCWGDSADSSCQIRRSGDVHGFIELCQYGNYLSDAVVAWQCGVAGNRWLGVIYFDLINYLCRRQGGDQIVGGTVGDGISRGQIKTLNSNTICIVIVAANGILESGATVGGTDSGYSLYRTANQELQFYITSPPLYTIGSEKCVVKVNRSPAL